MNVAAAAGAQMTRAASGRRALSGGARLPSLDGLRAISITLVLLGHLSGTAHFARLHMWFGDIAHLGVTIFFIISGFLITRLLIDDETRHGRVSLLLFYARRALRILPAFLAYLAVVALLDAAHVLHLNRGDLTHALTYTVNYETNRSWAVGHLWSLSVEEQFYLLWPFAFVWATRKSRVWIAAGAVAVGPLARTFAALALRGTPYRDLEMFPMVADSLAMGCLLACLQDWLEQRPDYLRLFQGGWSLALLALVLLINRYMIYTVVDVLGPLLENAALAILVHRAVARAEDPVGRLLNLPLLSAIGVLSYSLYLWQQPFINRHGSDWVNAFPENLLLSIAAALASYLLLERPLMRMRRRLHRATDSPPAPT